MTPFMLEDFRCQGDYLHKLPLAKLAGHRAKDASAARGVLSVNYDCGVIVEANVRAIGADILFGCAYHYSAHYLALFDRSTGAGFLHCRDDHVAHRSILTVVAAHHADAEDLFRPRVVRNP